MKILIKYLIYLFLSIFISFNNSLPIDIDLSKTDYFFTLEIPSIDLNQKVYEFNDEKNNVDKGIYLVKDYDFNSLNGSIILASHSGDSIISYFKNLHLVGKNDIVKIDYQGKIYVYSIDKIYKINKNGKFKYTNNDKQIYLITCDRKNKKKQLIFRGKLIKIIKKSTFY